MPGMCQRPPDHWTTEPVPDPAASPALRTLLQKTVRPGVVVTGSVATVKEGRSRWPLTVRSRTCAAVAASINKLKPKLGVAKLTKKS